MIFNPKFTYFTNEDMLLILEFNEILSNIITENKSNKNFKESLKISRSKENLIKINYNKKNKRWKWI